MSRASTTIARTSGPQRFSDVFGRVSFNALPERVRISVWHSQTRANYSRVVDVPPSGITELRMMVDTYE